MWSIWNNEEEVETGNVKINELHDFIGHPFRVDHDMQLFELSRSIEEQVWIMGISLGLVCIRRNTTYHQ